MEKILLVDDDNFFREIFAELLKGEGYSVDTAGSGNEALALLTGEHALVIADLVMPDMSGLDLLARVKRHDQAIEVIIVTGHADVETAIHALKNGAHEYLVKPVNHDEFKHAVALCLEQRRLFDENKELKGLVQLLQTGQTIATCFDLSRLHGLILELLAKEAGVTRGIALYTEGEGPLVLKEINGFTNSDAVVVADALKSRYSQSDPYAIERIEHFLPEGVKLKKQVRADLHEALLLYIKSSKGKVLGVVILFNDQNKSLPQGISRKNVSFILEQASLALENASRYANVKNLLYMDDLSGLFNHRYLDIAMDRELKRAERYSTGLTVLFIDIDSFKSINDCYGHLIGSTVLKEFGELLRKAIREIDTVIRYGGDEFIIILVQTTPAESHAIAERIRKAIEKTKFMALKGYDINLTACFGYACYPQDGKTRQELLDMADQAMYLGKNSGKNMVLRAGKQYNSKKS